ncbi:Alpha/Beta hydrolase protein, partial [Pilobolus umbonatus]
MAHNQTTIDPPSFIDKLPEVIPPTSRFNLIKNWWHRSDKTSSIAEARIIRRLYDTNTLQKITTPIMARIGRVSIDNEDREGKKAREVNTLYISQQSNQSKKFQFEAEPVSDHLTTLIQKEGDDNTKNLVMCHGYGAGLGFFYKNYGALSQIKGYRVFSIDWLGMGNSSRPKWTINKKSNQTWDDIVEEVEDHFVQSLEDWRSKVGLKKMTLFGHSLGGYFAACYALKYPERVDKLILVSPAGIPDSAPEDIKEPKDKSPQELLEKEAQEIGHTMQAEAVIAENLARKTSHDPSGTSSQPPAPRRKYPSWLVYLWNHNVTPMSIVRMTGPFGPSLINVYTSRRFVYLSNAEQHDLYDYVYHISSSSGSGEFALAAVLAPGAYARKPLFHRLAKLTMPTVFIYGDNDWMDYKAAIKA